MLNKQDKQEVINKFQISQNDSGSVFVQIGLLTERIKYLSTHLALFPKDTHSRVGLLKIVGKRKAFLNYLKKTDLTAYNDLMEKIG